MLFFALVVEPMEMHLLRLSIPFYLIVAFISAPFWEPRASKKIAESVVMVITFKVPAHSG